LLAGLGLLLWSCANQSGTGPHGTVIMRDGTSVAGMVLSTSASQVKIAGDDNVTRDIPMAQVKSINYDATGAAPAAAPVAAPAAGAPAAPPPPADADAHVDHYHADEAAVTSTTHELAAGTKVSVRTEETIDSGKAAAGQLFPADVTRNVLDASGAVVIPRGANAQIVIRSVSKGGVFHGASDLILDLASVSIGGRRYDVSTRDLMEKGRNGVGVNKRTGEFAGGGAAFGAIIGAIAGGGKGAAIGAGSGAGAGAVTEILTKGTIKVPVESILMFQLDQPLVVTAAR
jgi:hypothetical protein